MMNASNVGNAVMKRRRTKRMALMGSVAIFLGSSGALAQTDPAAAPPAATASDPAQAEAPATPVAASEDDKTIIVTGSRIRRTAADLDQPAEVLGSAEIAQRGYTDLGRALQELPAFGVPANSQIGSQGSYNAGASFANLYNLGSQRTLSLVNGQRFVSSASSSIFGAVAGSPVDLNSIPTTLIDRVETLSVGGAPIYGSDAIAGTVNIILKKNYQGLHLDAQTGIAQKGDAAEQQVSLLAGRNFAEDRGNVTLSVQYNHQDGLPTSARYYTGGNKPFFGTALAGSDNVYSLYQGGLHYNEFTNTGMPLFADSYPTLSGKPYAGITNAAGQTLYFNNSGQLAVFNPGQTTGSQLYGAGGDGFAIGDYENLITRSDRVQATLLAHYDFSDHIRLSAEGWYGHTSASNISAQPFYNTALFANAGETNGNLILSTANPYLSAADRATIVSNLVANGQDPSTFYLARANTDLATGAFTTTTDLYRVVGDLAGDFTIGSHNFNWDVSGTYGRVRSTSRSREVVTQNYYNALNAVTDASGNIVCATGYANATIPTFSSTCAPLNVFGVNQASQAALDYISADARSTQLNQQYDIIASLGGDIVRLPAGAVKFSLGYEHRYESVNFDPGAFAYGEENGDGTRTQYGNSIPIDPVRGSYHTNEGFGELSIPLVAPAMHVPLIYNLSLQGSARYVDNSIVNRGFWAYSGGGVYAPTRDISFRGNYTRSFRSPAITEAYAPTGSVFNTANDPCDARYLTAGPNPTRRQANCAAAGLPSNFNSNIVDYTAQGTTGGNPNLQNEVANSWTAGGVLTPRWLPGLTVSADYIKIDIKNEIATLGAEDLLNACYDSDDYPNNSFCSTFTRDASGQVTSFTGGNYNLAVEKFRAVQATVDYRFPLTRLGLPESAGALGLGANWLHTAKHYYRIGSGDQTYTVGTTQEPTDNVTANLNYYNGGLNFLWQTQYYGPTKITVNAPQTTYEYPNVKQYFMFNTSIGYTLNDRFRVRLVVDNVLDKTVPFPYAVSATRYYSAIIGRYFHLNFGIDF
ncbi:TonB-dependent receptor domain-containing protein [Sphingomonas sp. RIT328]|uniref:TonB-dependent receptor domain-containing protein n=1 Tax=Sphingomonas sp. RIT328 TaxID=1470591 RepID=UPI00044E0B38|nr:TonB-dependent receptor [Sphingomonas sp. RIT328]EZP50845.1 TonB-dependent Receptor Plug domain protein [Sphingomonas sp. RIT328]